MSSNSNIVKVVHALLKELRVTMASFYDECGFWIQQKDGTRVEVFQLPEDAPLPDLKDEWMSTVDPEIERQAAEILSLFRPLTEALKSASGITYTNVTSNNENTQKTQTPAAELDDDEESTLLTAKTNYSGTLCFPTALNFVAEVSQSNFIQDGPLLITSIRLYPKKVTINFENSIYTEVDYSSLPNLLQLSSAAPTLSFSSSFQTKTMTANMMDHAISFMNKRFWKRCRKVTFDGEFWLGPIITRIIKTIPTCVKSLMMRQLTFYKAYRLRWTVEIMKHLHHLNFDCRVTDNTDFFNNVTFLEKNMTPKTLKTVLLHVTGFPSNDFLFKSNQSGLEALLQKGGCATILTEEKIDDAIYSILTENRYSYVGTGIHLSPFSPFQEQDYDLFNAILVHDIKITIGLLHRHQ